MMKDSLIIIRAHDRLIITQDRSIRFIRGRLIITRAHDQDRLTIHGPVMAAASAEDMAEDMAEDTDTKRH